MNDDAISAGRTAAFLNRMLAVFFVTLLCLMLQRYGANLADILTAIITGTSGMRPGSSLMQYATSAFAGSAGFLLFQIGWILLALLMLLAFAIFTEWKGITGKRSYLVAWTIAGIASSPLILPFGGLIALSVLPKILIMAASGYLYWWLIGRSAGMWRHASWKNGRAGKSVRSGFRIVGYVFLAFLAYQIALSAVHLGRLAVYGLLTEAPAGTPPFKTKAHGGPAPAVRLAMHDFPDAASCLVPGALPSGEGLRQMNWKSIGSIDEAEVCMFRLIASYGDLSNASEWLEAQGFRSSSTANSSTPAGSSLDQTLHVQATWPIKLKGHPFRQSGVLARLTDWIPYALSVDTSWSADGTDLLSVDLIYLSL